jgi:hypothetical protein
MSLGNDWMMTIGQAMMSISLILAIPLNVHPIRKNISMMYFRCKGHASPNEFNVAHYVITFGIVLVITFLAIVIPDIVAIFSFLGGFCAAIICLLAPALIFWKLEYSKVARVLVLVIAIILTGMGFSSVILSAVR